MDIINKENNIYNILEYDVLDEEIKNKITNNINLNRKITNWISNSVGKGHINAVKNCYVEYIDYDSLDFDKMDEFEIKAINKKIKKNHLECPNHINCQMFLNNILKPGMKCPIELAECSLQTNKLINELEIKKEDVNDQILLSQLIGLNLIYNRSISGLSNSPLITEIRKVTNGAVTYDTKINENFNIAKSALASIESLRKSLILNRDDKAKLKKIKEGKTIEEVKETTSQIIKDQEDNFDIKSLIEDVTNSNEEIKTSNNNYGDIDA